MTELTAIINFIVNFTLNLTGNDPILTFVIIAALAAAVFKLITHVLKSLAVIAVIGVVLYYAASIMPSLPAL